MQEQLELTFQNTIAFYNELIEITKKETDCLTYIAVDDLETTIKHKKIILQKLTANIGRLGELLKQEDKEKFSNYINTIKELSKKLEIQNQINAQIAQQHIAFSQSMIDLYLSFKKVNQTYDKRSLIRYKSENNIRG
ncbi:MAG: flagellar export chaperone FlgN [Desulfurella sp.]|jgi:flagellar biosynthesis/type III secretory pathway chaperone